jgi:YggT family protein
MFSEIFTLVVDTLSSLYLVIILLRFILQLSRADFYNPISQFVVKATNPFVIPLRRIIPGFGGVDIASLVLALVFQALVLSLKITVLTAGYPNPLGVILMSGVLVLGVLLKVYFWSLLVMIVASWIAPGSANPALMLINQITEPLMKPFRSILPSMGGLDLSPILVFLVLQILEKVVSQLSYQVGMSFSLM